MWARASGLTNHELVDFSIQKDLVQVRSGGTSYGTIIFGKIRIPAVNDDLGEGFIHVRYVCRLYARASLRSARPNGVRMLTDYRPQDPRPPEQGESLGLLRAE